jgi:hypothetical protein
VQSAIRDNPNLTKSATAKKIERIRTRVWRKFKTGG